MVFMGHNERNTVSLWEFQKEKRKRKGHKVYLKQ